MYKQHKLNGMKRMSKLYSGLFGTALLLLIAAGTRAQSDTAKPAPAADTAAPAAAPAAPELLSPSVEFTGVQKGDGTVDLKAVFRAKISKGVVKNLAGLKVEFFAGTDSAETKVGEAETNLYGTAACSVPAEKVVTDAEGKINFTTRFAGTKKYESAEETFGVKKGRLIITPLKGDSSFSVTVKLVDLSTGTETPVPATDLGVFVKRLFNPMKVGEGTTDDNGEVSVDVPAKLPGDAKGNITILAKIDENEQFGNLEASVSQPWGLPVSDKVEDQPRALWSAHPPLWMLITFIVLMTAVWGHYIVIVYELFRLRKEPV